MTKFWLVAGIAALLPITALGQSHAGQWEGMLDGNGNNDKNFDSGAIGVAGSAGHYFTDHLELSLRQVVLEAYASQGANTFDGSTLVDLGWNFSLGKWQPFVGAETGYRYGQNIDSAWLAGVDGGIKYYVQPRAFLFARVEYQWDLAGDTSDDGAFVYSLGIGVNW